VPQSRCKAFVSTRHGKPVSVCRALTQQQGTQSKRTSGHRFRPLSSEHVSGGLAREPEKARDQELDK
jgi:hypothetical protein